MMRDCGIVVLHFPTPELTPNSSIDRAEWDCLVGGNHPASPFSDHEGGGGGAEGEAGRPGGTPELHRHVHGRHHWSLPLLGAVVAVVVVVGRQTVAHRWGVMATKKGSAHALSTFGYFGCACPLLLFCPFDCAFGHLWPSLPVWAFFPKISQLLAAFDCFWSPLGNVAKSN